MSAFSMGANTWFAQTLAKLYGDIPIVQQGGDYTLTVADVDTAIQMMQPTPQSQLTIPTGAFQATDEIQVQSAGTKGTSIVAAIGVTYSGPDELEPGQAISLVWNNTNNVTGTIL